MQPTTVQLWERIHASGLASPEDCRRWAKSVAASVGKEALSDPGLLTKELVGQGYLTPYQANVLYKGMSHPVQLGAIRVVRSLESEWGPYWYQGASSDNGNESNFSVVALAASSLVSGPLHDWPPSLVWAEEHCKTKSEYLDEWNVSGATLHHLFVAGTRTNEPTLSARLMDGPLDSDSCSQLVRDVATGLLRLHEAGLVHGRISLDAIQCTDEGRYRLLRDPIFPPSSAYGVTAPSVLGGSQDRYAVAAPELARSGALPTEQSDLYALGCVGYRALTGQWPFQPGIDAPPSKWSMLHAQIPVLMPDGLADPFAKCLMYLLAKSPTVRFRNANDLIQALRFGGAESSKKVADRAAKPVEVPIPASGTVAKHLSSEDDLRQQGRETKKSVDTNSVVTASPERPIARKAVPEARAPEKASPEKASPEKASPEKARAPKNESGKAVQKSAGSMTGDLGASESKADGIKSTVSNEKPLVTREPASSNPNTKRASEGAAREPEPASPVQNEQAASIPSAKAVVVDPVRETNPPVMPPLVEISNPLLGATKASSDLNGPLNPESKAPASEGNKPTIVLDKLNAFEVKEVGAKKKKKKPRSRDGEGKGKKVAEVGSKRFKGKRKAKRPVWFMPMVVICSLLLMLLLVLMLRNTSGGVVKIMPQERNKAAIAQNETVVPTEVKGAGKERVAIDPMLEYFALKEDDGKSPWTPPTIGSPYSTDMLPTGMETVVFLSGAALEQKKPIDQLLKWWGDVQGNALSIPEFTYLNGDGLESVAIAWYPGAEISTFQRAVRFTYSVSKPLSERILSSEAMEPKKVTSENGPSQTFWIASVDGEQIAFAGEELRSDANASVKRITVGPVGLIEQLAKNQGKSGPLRRQMETLLQATDSRADVTVLAAPSFLYGDGKLLMGEHSVKILALLRSFVDDNVQALMIRTHVEPAWYVEVRTLGNDLQSAFRDAAEAKKRLEGLPDEMEARFTEKPADAYWRALANRYPQMLRKLASYTRAASEDGQVVLNAYLPSEAILNMTISSWMAMQADGGTTTSKVAVAKPTPTVPKTPEELLEAKISIKLEQESLEAVLQAISNEVRDTHTGGVEALPMAINGGAFQKEGITRNQQIRGFDFKETPLRQVLISLARRANPVTTVQSPNEKDQKVVWVLLDDPATPSKKKLEMTTRVWVDSNQANLPTEFVIPKESKESKE